MSTIDPLRGVSSPQKIQEEEKAENSSSSMELPAEPGESAQNVTISSAKETSNVFSSFARSRENIKDLAQFLFSGVKAAGSGIKATAKFIVNAPGKLLNRSVKVNKTAADTFPKTEPSEENATKNLSTANRRIDIAPEQFQRALPMAMRFSTAARDIAKNLADPNITTEEKAIFVFQETNMLIGKMAIEDPEVAQGGADLTKNILERLARDIEQGPHPEVKSELDKPINEQKLIRYINKTTLIDDRKRNMQIELDNDPSPSPRVRGLRQEQINDFGVEDLAPNIMSTFDNLRKALSSE